MESTPATSLADLTTAMEDTNHSLSGGLGSQAIDSIDLHKKNRGLHQISHSKDSKPSITTTQRYSDSPLGAANTGSPSNNSSTPGGAFSTPTKFKPFKPIDLYSQCQSSSGYDLPRNPNSQNPNIEPQAYVAIDPEIRGSSTEGMAFHYKPKPRLEQSNVYPLRANPTLDLPVDPEVPRSPSSQTPIFGPHSPTKTSPSRKLQQVFQKATERVISKERVSSLIQTLEEEMQKSGVTVQLTELKNQLHNVQELQITSDEHVEFEAGGDIFDSNAPNHGPVQPAVLPQPLPKVKDWGSLFKAQGPSTVCVAGCESPYRYSGRGIAMWESNSCKGNTSIAIWERS